MPQQQTYNYLQHTTIYQNYQSQKNNLKPKKLKLCFIKHALSLYSKINM